jgi:hypothetical protein
MDSMTALLRLSWSDVMRNNGEIIGRFMYPAARLSAGVALTCPGGSASARSQSFFTRGAITKCRVNRALGRRALCQLFMKAGTSLPQ